MDIEAKHFKMFGINIHIGEIKEEEENMGEENFS